MFEFSVAGKYLIPRWRQLSVSLISLISILVIALVVWLVVVFFSVTDGLEKMWTQKLVALTAPVRVTPAKEYYNSYYYLVDSLSGASKYSLKSIAEKRESPVTDPYDPSSDMEIPRSWPQPDRNGNGELKDPVKLAFAAISAIKGVNDLQAKDFELGMSQIRLRMIRHEQENEIGFPYSQETQAFLTHQVFLGSHDPKNPSLTHALLPLSKEDMTNLIDLLSISAANNQEDAPEDNLLLPPEVFQKRAQDFFKTATITQLQTPAQGWVVPRSVLPKNGSFDGLIVERGDKIFQVILPIDTKSSGALKSQAEAEGFEVTSGKLLIADGIASFAKEEGNPIPLVKRVPIIIPEGINLASTLSESSLTKARDADQIVFTVSGTLQRQPLNGEAPLGSLEISKIDWKTRFEQAPEALPSWISETPNGYQLLSMALPEKAFCCQRVFGMRSPCRRPRICLLSHPDS